MFKRKQVTKMHIYTHDHVGCIGKLPLHREFIKQGVTLPEIASLDQWYQSAYYQLAKHYGEAVKEIFLHMPLYHFIYTAAPERQPMIGTVLSSQDQTGRIYPYVLFRLLENPIAWEFQNAIPVLYQSYFNATQDLCYSNWQQCTLPTLFQNVSSLNQTVIELSKRIALENTLTALTHIKLSELFPDKNLAVAIITALKNIRNTITNSQVEAIRFPLMQGLAANATAVFWLQLIYAILPDKYPRLQIFWHGGNAQHHAALLIYFKPMPTNQFYQLIDSQRQDSSFLDLLQEAKVLAVTEILSAVLPEMSLLQTLSAWSQQLKG